MCLLFGVLTACNMTEPRDHKCWSRQLGGATIYQQNCQRNCAIFRTIRKKGLTAYTRDTRIQNIRSKTIEASPQKWLLLAIYYSVQISYYISDRFYPFGVKLFDAIKAFILITPHEPLSFEICASHRETIGHRLYFINLNFTLGIHINNNFERKLNVKSCLSELNAGTFLDMRRKTNFRPKLRKFDVICLMNETFLILFQRYCK